MNNNSDILVFDDYRKKKSEDQIWNLMMMINVSIEMICQHKYGQILHTMSNDLSHSKSRMDNYV